MPNSVGEGLFPGGSAAVIGSDTGAQWRTITLPVAHLLLPRFAPKGSSNQPLDLSHNVRSSCTALAWSRRRAQVQWVSPSKLFGCEHERPACPFRILPRFQMSGEKFCEPAGLRNAWRTLFDQGDGTHCGKAPSTFSHTIKTPHHQNKGSC